MGLKDVLEKMKLVEADDSAPARVPPPLPPKVHAGMSPPPPPQMKDVLKAVGAKPPVDEAALSKAAPAAAGGGLGDIPSFEAIYKASGVIDPAHGFSAYKVLEILSSSDFEGLEPKAKAAALSGFLKMNPAGPVAIADVVQDAVRRDQALDGFEDFLRKKLDQRRAQLEQESEALQKEIDELTRRNKEKMDQNRSTLEGEKERLATWQARKRIEERRLFDAVAPFVQDNPVTLGESGVGTAKPPAS
jgi:hypothetical protein